MNCEPGDLARIIAPTENNPNLGKIVQCVRITHAHDFPSDYGPVWNIRSKDILWAADNFTQNITLETRNVACPDAWLKPYRPPALDKTLTKNKDIEKV